MHQSGAERASTFWSGCGDIRRSLFLEHSGFNERFGRPAIEDIELGSRLIRARRRIVLDREIQVTHLKTWTFLSLVKTDILDRGYSSATRLQATLGTNLSQADTHL